MPTASVLGIFPRHFVLRPGEQIHYSVCEPPQGNKPHCPDAKFSVADPSIVRMIDSQGILEAVASGHTELLVEATGWQQRITLTVAGPALPPMAAVPYADVHELAAKEFLFVGHANRDGYDHTAAAKQGIDRLVAEAKKNGWPVAYFVSKEYPDWYTADRRPDYAIISEGQEHQIRVEASRVIFTGGDFFACTLRNVQMTLHGMSQESNAKLINFIFPAQAIWVEDIWGDGEKQPYPAPMLLLSTLFTRRGTDAQKYQEVVVPFLDRVLMQYPILGYPPNPSSPPLSDLLKDWSITVRFGQRFQQFYRRLDPNKVIVFEFQDM